MRERIDPEKAALLAPVLVALLLSLPDLSLGYFWDDFLFLSRARADPIAAALYRPGTAFFRPLTQGLYFVLLAPLGAAGAPVAHVINLGLLVAATGLVAALTRRLAGPAAGLLAGVAFAGLAPAPSLVGWASGSQDLLAIVLLLISLHLRHDGRIVGSLIAWVGALLSKETAAVALPVLALWDPLIGRRGARAAATAAAFTAVVLVWATLHPGIRLVLDQGLVSGPRGYVGYRNPALTRLHAGLYALTLGNVPPMGTKTPWPGGLLFSLAAAILTALAGLWIVVRPRSSVAAETTPGSHASPPALPTARAALLGLLLAVPGVLLPALMIQRWVAYYACLPAIGTSIALGTLAGRGPAVAVAPGIALFLILGVWGRGAIDRGGDWLTEQSFVEASRATRQVETGFRSLRPTLPRGAQALVSVASSGMAGVYGTLHHGQALAVWYGDPALRTRTPERLVPGGPATFLFRVTGARDVIEIWPDRIAYRSCGAAPDTAEVRAVIRTFARGLAASGEWDRSVGILKRLARDDPPHVRSYDLRLAAMALDANGQGARAETLLAAAPPLPRDLALDGIAKVLAEPTSRPDLDSCAYRAFGIAPDDPDALRYWMAIFFGSELYPQALGFAQRLQALRPGDRESAMVIRRIVGRRPGRGAP